MPHFGTALLILSCTSPDISAYGNSLNTEDFLSKPCSYCTSLAAFRHRSLWRHPRWYPGHMCSNE